MPAKAGIQYSRPHPSGLAPRLLGCRVKPGNDKFANLEEPIMAFQFTQRI